MRAGRQDEEHKKPPSGIEQQNLAQIKKHLGRCNKESNHQQQPSAKKQVLCTGKFDAHGRAYASVSRKMQVAGEVSMR